MKIWLRIPLWLLNLTVWINNMKLLLDHGYIDLVETWGSDSSIIEAARMSTDKGFLGWGTPENPGDEKLLAYLYNNNHATPFEMAGMIIEVKAPIFVFREWHRHRTQSYNEMSARYIPIPDENYMPSLERLMSGGNTNTTNKQAQGSGGLTEEDAIEFVNSLSIHYQEAQILYQQALSSGVPKELARVCLPVARYSKMRASANLRNWLAFLTLRKSDKAQYEIRVYAEAIAEIISQKFPRTFELFDKNN